MNQKEGFTFIEILFVISAISILMVLIIPNTIYFIEKQQTKHFFKVLDADILMIQNQSIGVLNNVRIDFYEDSYIIMHDHDFLARRDYPIHVNYILRSNNRITFNHTGSMMNPKSYRFKDRHTTYQIVFPLGKGRHYIEEL